MQLEALIAVQWYTRRYAGRQYSGTGLSDLSVKTEIGNEPMTHQFRDCQAVGRDFQSTLASEEQISVMGGTN
jgi:hypothetical protein